MSLSRTGLFLTFEWLIFLFDHFAHSRVANFTAAEFFKRTPPWPTYGFVTID